MSNAREIADAGHQLAAWVNFNGAFNDASGQSGTYACSGSTITITDTAHGLVIGDSIHAVFTRSAGDTTTITDDFFTVLTVPSVDTFTIQTVVATTDQSGSVAYDSDAATATAGSGPIRASYNVSSCQFNGTGDYTVNFATAMPDVNYSANAWAGGGSAGAAACSVVQDGYLSISSVRIQTRDLNTSASHNTNNMYESSIVMVSVFR